MNIIRWNQTDFRFFSLAGWLYWERMQKATAEDRGFLQCFAKNLFGQFNGWFCLGNGVVFRCIGDIYCAAACDGIVGTYELGIQTDRSAGAFHGAG